VGRALSLFARTGLTLAVALAVFMVFTTAAMVSFILIPLAKQGAGDLAALMVLAAQTWVELPPETRPFLEQELKAEYRLRVAEADEPLPRSNNLLPFLRFLEKALTRRIGEPATISARADNGTWYSADIPMGGRTIRVSFPRERIGARPPTAALLVIATGGVVILLTTLLLVRRLTRPLARLCEATSRIGRGESLEPLPEKVRGSSPPSPGASTVWPHRSRSCSTAAPPCSGAFHTICARPSLACSWPWKCCLRKPTVSWSAGCSGTWRR
jgi:two-component system osmolarity sensor histidine kinase EnvZ